MTFEEEKAVLLLEMRLKGVPYQVVNYFRRYVGCSGPRSVSLDDAREWLEREGIAEQCGYWLAVFGHHFEDAENLPLDEEWRLSPRSE